MGQFRMFASHGKKDVLEGMFSTHDAAVTLMKAQKSGLWVIMCIQVKFWLKVLLMLVVFFPLVVLYKYGVLISTTIAAIRTIATEQRDDYGIADGNLKPALGLLYFLALMQGSIFCYVFSSDTSGVKLVEAVALQTGLNELGGTDLLWLYMMETRKACDLDPLASQGRRNLITFAADFMVSISDDDYIVGARIIDALIQLQTPRNYNDSGRKEDSSSSSSSSSSSPPPPSPSSSSPLLSTSPPPPPPPPPKPINPNTFWLLGQRMQIKQLLTGSASSGYILEKLLRTLGPRSQYGREMRGRAARIVAFLAREIHLDQFPGGIHLIASLLVTSPRHDGLDTYELDWQQETLMFGGEEEHYSRWCNRGPPTHFSQESSDIGGDDLRGEHGYKELLLQGLRILSRLAANENNCRVISDTRGLLSKIMAPLASDLLHYSPSMDSRITVHEHDDSWSSIVEESLKAMHQLLSSSETGVNLRPEIARDAAVRIAMERILKCGDCVLALKKQAMMVLSALCTDGDASVVGMEPARIENFYRMLLDSLVQVRCHVKFSGTYYTQTGDTIEDPDTTSRLQFGDMAAARLLRLSLKMERNTAAVTFLMANNNHNILDHLIAMLLDVQNNTNGPLAAAVILKGLCSHSANDHEYRMYLMTAMTDLMPKVLEEILHSTLPRKKQTGTTEATSTEKKTDVESSFGDSEKNAGPSFREMEREERRQFLSNWTRREDEDFVGDFIIASLSLCVTVCETFILENEDLSSHFNAIAHGNAALWFPRMLKEMVERNNESSVIENLRLLKLISKMVILIMTHKGMYDSKEVDSMMQALVTASRTETMLDLDGSMIFATDDDDDDLMFEREKPIRTLASLVKEAQDLVARKKAAPEQSQH